MADEFKWPVRSKTCPTSDCPAVLLK